MTTADTSWKAIATAPLDRDLELGVMEGSSVHALVFACRRVRDDWINSTTQARVPVRPTHWREWSDRG